MTPTASDHRRARPRLWGLLLCLALALPFAQFGALAHALSHLRAPERVQAPADKPLPAHAGCESCVGYSALGDAPVVTHATPAATPARHAAPARAPAAARCVPVVLAYASRAPPPVPA
jgi:hypothetical protein